LKDVLRDVVTRVMEEAHALDLKDVLRDVVTGGTGESRALKDVLRDLATGGT
jgi:membrane peptidoglycan carboxypeptidase